MTPGERERALRAVAGAARSRNAEAEGFDCVLAFLPYDAMVRMFDGYPATLFSTPEEHAAAFSSFTGDPEGRFRLIVAVLEEAIDAEDEASAGVGGALAPDEADVRTLAASSLARRIWDRMDATLTATGVVSRPLLYGVAAAGGFAVAVAVYDEFWTDAW